MSKKDLNPVVTTALELADTWTMSVPLLRDNPKILSILSAFRRGEVGLGFRLLEEVAPEYEGDRESFFIFRQFSGLIRKVPFKKTDINRQHAALTKFLLTEARMKRVNRRIKHYLVERPDRLDPSLFLSLWTAKKYIRNVLGRLTTAKYRKILHLSRPGPGLSIGTWNKYRTSGVYKYVATSPMFTPGARGIAIDWLRENVKPCIEHAEWAGSSRLSVRFPIDNWCVAGNRITFVPKDGRSLRSIAVEPALNVQVQLGVHEYLRALFVRKGVCDLGDQSQNQMLSYIGSASSDGLDPLVTLDLASASDSVSIELVRWLLPSDWFGLLDALRSTEFSLKSGAFYKSEKFSTMGNGFTFALECLIFKALAEAAVAHCKTTGITSVYGDDIVVPRCAAAYLIELLTYCGFKVNTEKSFVFGPFRESCGTDWYNGSFVTPVYVKTENLTAMDCNRIYNTFPSLPGRGAVRDFLLRKLKEASALHFCLENEDASSGIFTTIEYLKGIRKAKWNAALQTHTYRKLTLVSAQDNVCLPQWRYSQALLGGGDPSLRDVTSAKLRWTCHGRIPKQWFNHHFPEIIYDWTPFEAMRDRAVPGTVPLTRRDFIDLDAQDLAELKAMGSSE
jgi:hypothetical protein